MFSIVITTLLAIAALNVLMYVQQPAMIFIPVFRLDAAPSKWGLDYEDVALTTSDAIRLHGWYIPAPDSSRVVLFLHGNAGNISHRRDSIEIFHRLGLSVLIFDYRGYGQSEGRPSERGLYADALAAWQHLTHERGFAAKDVIVFGRSLGGAVAAKLAADVQPRALILESTFSSAGDFSRIVFPVLSRLVLLRYRFDTVAQVRSIHCPLLVLHSPDDEIIPYSLGRKVFEAANEPKQFVTMSGDHNTGFLLSQPGYARALAAFIATEPA